MKVADRLHGQGHGTILIEFWSSAWRECPPPLPSRHLQLEALVPGVQRPPDAYTSVMVIGRLVISLVGWMVPGWEFTTAPDDPWRPARRCIWPAQSGGRTWPPEAALTSLVEVEQFAAAATT